MKYLIIASLLLVGCADEYTHLANAPGANAPAALAPSFEGYYLFPSTGYAQIDQSAFGLNNIRQLRLVVPNNDGSNGLYPVSSLDGLPTVNGSLVYNTTLTYVLANNLKQDNNANNIVGAFSTQFIVSRVGGVVQIRAIIGHTSGQILSDHTVSAQ